MTVFLLFNVWKYDTWIGGLLQGGVEPMSAAYVCITECTEIGCLLQCFYYRVYRNRLLITVFLLQGVPNGLLITMFLLQGVPK